MSILTYLTCATLPGIAAFLLVTPSSPMHTARAIAHRAAWLILLVGFLSIGQGLMAQGSHPLHGWGCHIEQLQLLLAVFVVCISGIVHTFAYKYMAGDRKWNAFFLQLGWLTSSLLWMLGADNVVLILVFWTSSNVLLACLMIHKGTWAAARNSGILLGKVSVIGTASLALAIGLLVTCGNTYSLKEILANHHTMNDVTKKLTLLCLILVALVQSGTWPFHKWLLSSLNSPTPVSGFMHAGLVNGGGFLLVRFTPLFTDSFDMLHILFTLGWISVLLGTAWKLVQTTTKSMLTCSTMAQMGFMLMQCGLGLFSAAIAHVCWHGLFKCYLFLNSGSTGQLPRHVERRPLRYVMSLLLGVAGAWGFLTSTQIGLEHGTTEIMLIGFAWLASTQLVYAIVRHGSLRISPLIGTIGAWLFGTAYGYTVYGIQYLLAPLGVDLVVPIDPLYALGFGILCLLTMSMNLLPNLFTSKRLYTYMLNASRSDPRTMTRIRHEYHV